MNVDEVAADAHIPGQCIQCGIRFEGRSAEDVIAHFKIDLCPTKQQHDWSTCFFRHPKERAARRSLQTHHYAAVMCSSMLHRGSCAKGNSCTLAHSVFEYHMHPDKFRVQLCREGAACQRPFCFFAHTATEKRAHKSHKTAAAAAAAEAEAASSAGQSMASTRSSSSSSGGGDDNSSHSGSGADSAASKCSTSSQGVVVLSAPTLASAFADQQGSANSSNGSRQSSRRRGSTHPQNNSSPVLVGHGSECPTAAAPGLYNRTAAAAASSTGTMTDFPAAQGTAATSCHSVLATAAMELPLQRSQLRQAAAAAAAAAATDDLVPSWQSQLQLWQAQQGFQPAPAATSAPYNVSSPFSPQTAETSFTALQLLPSLSSSSGSTNFISTEQALALLQLSPQPGFGSAASVAAAPSVLSSSSSPGVVVSGGFIGGGGDGGGGGSGGTGISCVEAAIGGGGDCGGGGSGGISCVEAAINMLSTRPQGFAATDLSKLAALPLLPTPPYCCSSTCSSGFGSAAISAANQAAGLLQLNPEGFAACDLSPLLQLSYRGATACDLSSLLSATGSSNGLPPLPVSRQPFNPQLQLLQSSAWGSTAYPGRSQLAAAAAFNAPFGLDPSFYSGPIEPFTATNQTVPALGFPAAGQEASFAPIQDGAAQVGPMIVYTQQSCSP